ncbi:MAG: undecaprenyl/decaprenyl-phosphate alpha-N-acetylglucosaminyl 1-phosphate transferase [Myxococcales bacterium]|nr:undecaprenyl/decaprenyl-phosphate alpha-N-acetylglucosaminyl 1-phosphate transferase [Myxococcales bacterium]
MQPLDIALPFFVAFGAALAVTPLVRRLALGIGAVDRPSERGVSLRPRMPLLGGLALGVGLAAGLAAALWLGGAEVPGQRLRGLLLGGALLLAVGIWDDRFGMRAWPKLAFQLLAAAIAILHGFQIYRLTDPITLTLVDLPTWLAWLASLAWIVGVTNAMNLLDGLDGLATGVGAIIGATLTLIAWQAGQPFGVCLGIALVAALLGFLPHNFPPARIFLGDTGSLLTGYMLALLAIEGYRRVSLLTFVVPLLALAVPILDTLLSIVRRAVRGAPIFSPDRLHMHHRMLESEGSDRAAVLQFYFLTAAFCLIAVSFTRLRGITAAIFLAAVIALTLRLLRNLGALSFRTEEKRAAESLEEERP